MASSKPTLNPLTDTPVNKSQITKPFMLAYIKSEKATDEDRKWFKELVSDPNNQEPKTSQLNGKTYIDIKIPEVRMAFIDRFFPQINAKKRTKKTFIEEILDL